MPIGIKTDGIHLALAQVNPEYALKLEKIKTSASEWTHLHEKNLKEINFLRNSSAVMVGSIIGTEGVYRAYSNRFPKDIPYNERFLKTLSRMPKRFAIFATMSAIAQIPYIMYVNNAVTNADKYANEHADMNSLQAGKNLFTNLQELEDNEEKKLATNQDLSIFWNKTIKSTDTHPTHKERAQTIQDEIDRREMKQALEDENYIDFLSEDTNNSDDENLK